MSRSLPMSWRSWESFAESRSHGMQRTKLLAMPRGVKRAARLWQGSAETHDALHDSLDDSDAVTGPQAGESMPTAIANARSSAAILSGGNIARKSVKADLGRLISSSQ